MKNVVGVINGLTEREAKLVDIYFHLNENKLSSKKKKLFTLIRYKGHTWSDALRVIYQNRSLNEFPSKLAERLMDDLCSAMLLADEDSGCRNILKNKMRCTRLIDISQQFFNRDNYTEARNYLFNAMKIARENELYDEQLCIYKKYYLSDLFYGERSDVMNIDLRQTEENIIVITNCEMLHNEIKSLLYKGTIPKLSNLREWQEKLEFMLESKAGRKSSRVKFICCQVQSLIALFMNESKQALYENSGALKILNRSRIFNGEKLLPAINAFNTILHLKLENLSEAKRNFKAIRENTMLTHLNYDPFALENIFRAAMFFGDKNKAEVVLSMASKCVLIEAIPYLKFKWTIFSAILAFQQKQFAKAKAVLDKISYYSKSKTALEFYTYVLKVMCAVEVNKPEDLLANSRTWQQLLLRNVKTFSNKEPRLSAILQILKTLFLSQFNFQKTIEKENVLMEKLLEGKGPYTFEQFGFEAIRFDKWMMKRKDETQ